MAGYFFEPDPKGSLRRNNEREGKRRVPPAGLFGTLKRLQRPRRDEGFDGLYLVRISESGDFRAEPWGGADDETEGGRPNEVARPSDPDGGLRQL